ncbi:DNA topoisomerase IA [Catovirus CTV1]|uniref:DNA topoisomerase n=1 Tax=Catovirus CTV1 TaxID=1977631 RepID=A0A1V0SB35_9VIRU|nr:DNA topoisomerase IA [Catovirus CTV1]
MKKTLVLLESPAKIKKMKSILGDKYEVMASVGHIMDLKSNCLSIDVKNNFKPEYVVDTKSNGNFKSKAQIVKELQAAAKKSCDVLLATDEDREGEMIAWCLAEVLKLKDPKRITFNSITKKDVMNAVQNPRKIDNDLVDAQKARRILDRIVGFELSGILWGAMSSNSFSGDKNSSLSAGRVQSVVVKIIVDKEKEIEDFFKTDALTFFKFSGLFNSNLKAVLYKQRVKEEQENDDDEQLEEELEEQEEDEVEEEEEELEEEQEEQLEEEEYNSTRAKGDIVKVNTEKEAREIMKKITESKFKVKDITERESKRNPSAPFITSTLQQEAATKLGFSVQKTMRAAQNLYEAGHITYMRTDSVSLSEEAMNNIKKYIIENYGKEYHRQMNYKSKSKNSQEAHEAIRPTEIDTEEVEEKDKIGVDEVRLYDLIWKRTVASQMSPAIVNVVDIIIEISKLINYYFLGRTERVVFMGYLKVYNMRDIENEEEEEIKIKVPKKGELLKVNNVTCQQDYEKPDLRYNEASLVKKLDKLGIGRPSTYASNITTIQKRGYVEVKKIDGVKKTVLSLMWSGEGKNIKENKKETLLGKENNKLVPTEKGIKVNEFLEKNFSKILDYKFTSNMEEELDVIAEGKKKWYKVLEEFYKEFHPIVEKLKTASVPRNDENLRILGKDPKTNEEIGVTIKKYGPVAVRKINDKKPEYVSIKPPLKPETITLKEALKLFEYPKKLGILGKESVMLNNGMYGLYITCGDTKINLSKNEEYKNKTDLTFEEAKKLVEDDKKTYIWKGSDEKAQYVIMNGPYGHYIKTLDKSGKKQPFVSLPKDVEIEKINLDIIRNIISKSKKLKKTATKTTTKSATKPTTKPTTKSAAKAATKATNKKIIVKGKKI